MHSEVTHKPWEFAGFVDKKSGLLGKPVPTGELFVPNSIRLDPAKRSLVWTPGAGGKSIRPNMTNLFDGFVRLGQEPPAAILDYARRWGLLYLDADGTPCVMPYRPQATAGRTLPRSEPLDAWEYYSRRASAVLSIADALQKQKRASPSDWQVLGSLDKKLGEQALRDLRHRGGAVDLYALTGCLYSAKWDIEQERRWLAMEVALWLALGRPGFSLNPRSWRLEVDYSGCLFAAIALQLALTVTDARNLFTCSGCGVPYVREKKAPKSGQANYCEKCGPNASLREANNRVRERIAEARRLRAEGIGLREIAQQLNVRTSKRSTALETVQRWIGKE